MNYLNEVIRQTADEGYFDFARCRRKDGTIYGSPSGICKKGTLIGDDEDVSDRKSKRVSSSSQSSSGEAKKMQLTAKIKAMSAADLQKVIDDPRLSDRQKRKLNRLIKAKKAEEGGSAAAKVARPVDPKVAAKVDKAMAAKGATPKPTPEQEAAMAKNRKELEQGPGRTVAQEMARQMLRGEVRLDANALAFNPMYQGKTQESLSTLKSSYKTMQGMMKDPYFNTPANRARVINTRIAIWRTEKAIRESSAIVKLDPKTYAKDLKNSPKYEKTPGSTKAISKAKAEDLPELEKQMKALSAKLDRKSLSTEEAMKISDEMLDLNRRLMVARGDSKPAAPNLKKIYEEQGFNAKPELVATAADLTKRKDLLTNMDGTNVVLYRGVTTQEFSDQFKGIGPDGGTHFPGRGIFGNGSYAGAPSFENPGGTTDAGKNVAAAYSGERKDLASKVTAFGLRSDANVATFKGAGYNERSRAYDAWYDRTLKEAESKTGYRFSDVGEAAAALGIHAYQVPQRDGDYYVVLNRGAVVAAMDSLLSNDTGL
jgi:hypothetical protein